MDIIPFIAGNLTAIVMLGLGFYVGRKITYSASPQLGSPEPFFPSFPTVFKARKEKRKPKSISEADLWKKEQAEAPMDPGVG